MLFWGILKKKEYKLSELVELYMKSHMPDYEDNYCEISLCIEVSDYGSIHIGFDKEADKKWYNCEIRFSINKKDGKMYSFEVGEYSRHRGDILKKSIHGDIEKLIFNIYASQSVVIVDENDCQTEFYHESY